VKRTCLNLVVLATLSVSSCGPGTSQPSLPAATVSASEPAPPPSTTPGPQAQGEPVYVSALCTLMGRGPQTSVAADRPVIIRWGWNATTGALVQAHIDNSKTIVTLDGAPVEGQLKGGIVRDATKGYYLALWQAEVGTLGKGTHPLTYHVSWAKQISDGNDTFGPGTRTESLSDECSLIVE